MPLGPGLGQCCGGAVRLHYTFQPHLVDLPQVFAQPSSGGTPQALWLWGAGHVGRACVHLSDPDTFRITWIDTTRDRFPAEVPDHVEAICALDMPRLASRAARGAEHLIFTYSHEIDLALCAALLRRGVKGIGLIGSDTKWARFSKRLTDMGLDPARIVCPIGEKRLGKHPDAIAHGVLQRLNTDRRASL